MNRITFPLEQQMEGPAVAELQDALQQFLDRGIILADDEGTRQRLAATLSLLFAR